MAHWKIPLYKIYWDEEDVNGIIETIKRGMFWAIGPNIEKFEGVVADYVGAKYAVAFNSGTSALHAILLAYDIKEGDELIVPSFTFIATANCALFVHAKPVFAEIEEKTCGLNPEDVKERISSKTKAIIPIHYGGLPCQIRELKEIADDYNLSLIEDAAESFGAHIDGKKVGTFGHASMFSFCGNKVITTGEGGIIITDSKNIYDRLKLIRSHGRQEIEDYFTSVKTMDYATLGYNWRMSNITATIGISQVKKLNKVIDMRRANATYLTEKLSKISRIVPPNPPKGYFHIYQMYTIRIRGGDVEVVRDALKNYLAEKGVMTKVYFLPVHLTRFYRERFGFKGEELPVTERLSKQVLSLPMYPTLTTNEMDYITENVRLFMKNYASHAY
jgi:perosamine synthetase